MKRRIFNRTGCCIPEMHYIVNPLRNLEKEIMRHIEQNEYFIIHAPRQSGKTTLLHSFARKLNQTGNYISVVFSLESASYRSVNEKDATIKILESLYVISQDFLNEKDLPSKDYKDISLFLYLSEWTKKVEKPIVLFIDEIDSLYDDVLISVLRQLRNGFQFRPNSFPASIALVGLRDIREYKIKIKNEDGSIGTASPFNIKADSFRLENFSLKDITELFEQYTNDTQQVFTKEVTQLIYDYTWGQPWLVNAMAYEMTTRILDEDYTVPLTLELVEKAKENIILRRDTHLDSLLVKLNEPRIKNIVAKIFSGDSLDFNVFDNDLRYVMDLGIIKKTNSGVKFSNLIYEDIITRLLNSGLQENMIPIVQSSWFINKEGKLKFNDILKEFQQFYRENSESWLDRFDYQECGQQLLFLAFLQRVVNGGGKINREMALGNGRADIFIEFANEKFVVELKIKNQKFNLGRALTQLDRYLDTLGENKGWLMVFELKKSTEISWEERIKWTETEHEGKKITIVEM